MLSHAGKMSYNVHKDSNSTVKTTRVSSNQELGSTDCYRQSQLTFFGTNFDGSEWPAGFLF